MDVPGDIRTQYNCYNPQKYMFMPRIGPANLGSDAWVIHAGYGRHHNVNQLNNYTILNLNPPPSGSANFSNDATDNRLANPNNPLTFANPFGVTNRSSTVSANVLNTDNIQRMVKQWSFDIQRRLPFDLALNVGYVGTGTASLDNTGEATSPAPGLNTPTSSLQSRRPYQFINGKGAPSADSPVLPGFWRQPLLSRLADKVAEALRERLLVLAGARRMEDPDGK